MRGELSWINSAVNTNMEVSGGRVEKQNTRGYESIREADFNPLISLAGSLKIPIMLGSVLFLKSLVAVSQIKSDVCRPGGHMMSWLLICGCIDDSGKCVRRSSHHI